MSSPRLAQIMVCASLLVHGALALSQEPEWLSRLQKSGIPVSALEERLKHSLPIEESRPKECPEYTTSSALLEKDPRQIPYILPPLGSQQIIGKSYFREVAKLSGATYAHNPPGVGLMENLDVLRGPRFDPQKVHPLIRDFYQSTSDYKITLQATWEPVAKIAFLQYRKLAKIVGQTVFPVDENNTIVLDSAIETLDFDHDSRPDVIGWVRTIISENVEQPMYVADYTTIRIGETGYIRAGFPGIGGALTATLRPEHVRQDGLLLKSIHVEDDPYVGFYYSQIDPCSKKYNTAFRLRTFGDEIELFVENDQLYAQHRFYFVGSRLLTLDYSFERVR